MANSGQAGASESIDDVSIYDQIVSASPEAIDPLQFTQSVHAKSATIEQAKDEEREAKLLLYLSVAGVLTGVVVGWVGAVRRR